MGAIQYPGGVVSLPVQSKTTMKFDINVSEGFNAVIKRVGRVSGYYGTDNLGTESVVLAPGASHSILQGVTALCIGTSAPVQVTVTVGTVSMTFNVNSALVLDDSYDSVTVANSGTATASAQLSLFYTKP